MRALRRDRSIAAALARTARPGLAARGLHAEGTRLALAAGLVVLGAVLVLDFKGISSAVVRNSSGFTPWARGASNHFARTLSGS